MSKQEKGKILKTILLSWIAFIIYNIFDAVILNQFILFDASNPFLSTILLIVRYIGLPLIVYLYITSLIQDKYLNYIKDNNSVDTKTRKKKWKYYSIISTFIIIIITNILFGAIITCMISLSQSGWGPTEGIVSIIGMVGLFLSAGFSFLESIKQIVFGIILVYRSRRIK